MKLDWDQLRVEVNSGGFSQWPGGHNRSGTWMRRVIADNDLWLIHHGNCTMQTRNGPARLGGDAIIWMRPGHFYEIEQDPDDPIGMDYIHFDLAGPDGEKYYPSLDEMPELPVNGNPLLFRRMTEQIVTMLRVGNSNARSSEKEALEVGAQMLKALLMSLEYDQIPNASNVSDESRRSARLALDGAIALERSREHFVEIAELAERFGLGRNRFTEIFSRHWGITPQEYQIQLRIDRARKLLCSSDQPIYHLAKELGYSDPYYFVKQFKERTGTSPGAFRKANHHNQGDA